MRRSPQARKIGRSAARLIGATAGLGVAVAIVSLSLPFLGEELLAWLRGREIASPAARAILPKLLLFGAAAGFGAAGLLLSTSGLLYRAESGDGVENRPGEGERPPLTGISRKSVLLLLAIAAAFGGLELGMAGRSLTYDEILAVQADVRTPWRQALEPRAGINHISGALLARASRAMLGNGERSLRAGGIILGAASMAALGLWVLRRSGSPGAAAWLMTSLGANALMLHTAMQIRGYGPLVWFGAATTAGACAVLQRQHRSPVVLPDGVMLVGLLIAAILFGLSHIFGLFYLGVLATSVHWILWRRAGDSASKPPRWGDGVDRRRALLAGVLAVATIVGVITWLPMFPWFFYFSGTAAREGLARKILAELSMLFLGRPDLGLAALLPLMAMALAGTWMWKRDPADRPLAVVGTIPLGILLVATALAKPTFFYARFMLCGLVTGLMVMALAVGAIDRNAAARHRGLVPLALTSLTLIMLVPGAGRLLAQGRGYREAVADLELLLRTSDPGGEGKIIALGPRESRTIINYYATRGIVIDDLKPVAWRQRRSYGASDLIAIVGQPQDPPGLVAAVAPLWHTTIVGSAEESPIQVWGFTSSRRNGGPADAR